MAIRRTRTVPTVLVAMLMTAWVIVTPGVLQVPIGSFSPSVNSLGLPINGGEAGVAPPTFPTTGTAVVSTVIPSSQPIDFAKSAPESTNGGVTPVSTIILFPLPKYDTFLQRRRNKLEIYAEILRRLMADPLGITEIALFCRLNFSSAKEMVDYLVSTGLLETIDVENETRYRTTPKGPMVIKDIERVAGLFQPSLHA